MSYGIQLLSPDVPEESLVYSAFHKDPVLKNVFIPRISLMKLDESVPSPNVETSLQKLGKGSALPSKSSSSFSIPPFISR